MLLYFLMRFVVGYTCRQLSRRIGNNFELRSTSTTCTSSYYIEVPLWFWFLHPCVSSFQYISMKILFFFFLFLALTIYICYDCCECNRKNLPNLGGRERTFSTTIQFHVMIRLISLSIYICRHWNIKKKKKTLFLIFPYFLCRNWSSFCQNHARPEWIRVW